MLAVVKTPHTELRIEGEDIPEKLLTWLDSEYGNVEVRDDDEMVIATETAWYKEAKATMTPGRRLRLRRENAGLTQAELGEAAGVSRKNISDIENGRRPIGKAVAERLATALNLPVGVLQRQW
ncbi:MAG: helix-turn-helix domain-containing protein [Proteobacteria bacterium]|nr:helix-turn-helix domain-containing protein [Pseudomonadota bacterium]